MPNKNDFVLVFDDKQPRQKWMRQMRQIWVCQIRHMVLTIGIDRILICGVFASDSILILNKVLSFHSKEHTFFY